MFTIILTLMTAPVAGVAGQAVTLEPELTIAFTNTTEKKATADCAKVNKAFQSVNRIAFCSPASLATPASVTLD